MSKNFLKQNDVEWTIFESTCKLSQNTIFELRDGEEGGPGYVMWVPHPLFQQEFRYQKKFSSTAERCSVRILRTERAGL